MRWMVVSPIQPAQAGTLQFQHSVTKRIKIELKKKNWRSCSSELTRAWPTTRRGTYKSKASVH